MDYLLLDNDEELGLISRRATAVMSLSFCFIGSFSPVGIPSSEQ
jgi:hypothetical protein